MEMLGAFNLLEEYIAKTNYKIDEIDQLISAVSLSNACTKDLVDILKQIDRALQEHKIKLENIIDDLEYSQRFDYMFVSHHDTHSNKKIAD